MSNDKDLDAGTSAADAQAPSAEPTDAHNVQWGTIYSQGREHVLGGVERRRSTQWSTEDEDAYMARVREKAQAMAVNILEKARQEAQALRDQAMQQGYDEGLAHAQEELDAFRSGMADSVSAVLSTIEGQCGSIFHQWREDLLAVTKLAVEKITLTELSEDKRHMLETLLAESVALLEQRRELTIRVNPEDEPVIADIIALTKEKFPDVQAWRVKADASISPGGMVVESASSLAESRIESRKLAVEEVLAHLTLPGLP